MLQDEYAVYDPEWSLTNVIQHTHYMPEHWKDKLHSDDVKREFMQLYTMKLTIFIEEVLSVFLTPFILYFSLPKSSDRIIDFFREFTVHIDGVGYVCSFGMFDFKKPGQHKAGDLREEYFATKDNKMLASYLGFMDQYHPTNKHGKRLQPTHPFMISPVLTGDNAAAAGRWPQNRYGQDQRAPNLAQSMFRENPTRMQSSMMMRSSLLDHHHQPANTYNRNPRAGFHPSTAASLKEEDDYEDNLRNTSARGFQDGLGESFVSSGVKGIQTEHTDDKPVSGGAGVLGMLNQFVAAGGEGAGRPGGGVV